jgi:sirohydrochlorin cobaltochelatase
MLRLSQTLTQWLEQGGTEIGQIHIGIRAREFSLCHRDDAGREDLAVFQGAEAARGLSKLDDRGAYRPLKSAPNLRHGWTLLVSGVDALRHALDYFYPAMLGVWRSHQLGALTPVPLSETLARQSGMYAITRKVTDRQAGAMIADFCRTDGGCLKRILWPLAPGTPIPSLPSLKTAAFAPAGEMPLLCQEACNLLVARAREVVKRSEYLA